MGRSVSSPRAAVARAYGHFDDDDRDAWVWDEFIYDLRAAMKRAFKSLEDCSRWLDREDHAILENRHAYVGVSEYCGAVCVWLARRDNDTEPGLSEHWLAAVHDRFLKVAREVVPNPMVRIGAFSNGEAVYRRLEVSA